MKQNERSINPIVIKMIKNIGENTTNDSASMIIHIDFHFLGSNLYWDVKFK
jgi:hypothetical protein